MKKLLFCAVLLCSGGFALGSEVQKAQHFATDLVAIAQEKNVQDLVFAMLYYMLVSHEKNAYDLFLADEYADSKELREFWGEKLIKQNELDRSKLSTDALYFEKLLYRVFSNALAKNGMIELKYGPQKGTMIPSVQPASPWGGGQMFPFPKR